MKDITYDFSEVRKRKENLNEEQLNEFLFSMTAALGGVVKSLLGMMGLGDSLGRSVNIKGSRQEVSTFTRALKAERRHMDALKKYGLDNPSTYRSKTHLAKAVKGFENTTGLKWPIG
jgi:hypothetical protein